MVLKLSCCKKKEETPEKIKLGENGTSEVNQTLMPKGETLKIPKTRNDIIMTSSHVIKIDDVIIDRVDDVLIHNL